MEEDKPREIRPRRSANEVPEAEVAVLLRMVGSLAMHEQRAGGDKARRRCHGEDHRKPERLELKVSARLEHLPGDKDCGEREDTDTPGPHTEESPAPSCRNEVADQTVPRGRDAAGGNMVKERATDYQQDRGLACYGQKGKGRHHAERNRVHAGGARHYQAPPSKALGQPKADVLKHRADKRGQGGKGPDLGGGRLEEHGKRTEVRFRRTEHDRIGRPITDRVAEESARTSISGAHGSEDKGKPLTSLRTEAQAIRDGRPTLDSRHEHENCKKIIRLAIG